MSEYPRIPRTAIWDKRTIRRAGDFVEHGEEGPDQERSLVILQDLYQKNSSIEYAVCGLADPHSTLSTSQQIARSLQAGFGFRNYKPPFWQLLIDNPSNALFDADTRQPYWWPTIVSAGWDIESRRSETTQLPHALEVYGTMALNAIIKHSRDGRDTSELPALVFPEAPKPRARSDAIDFIAPTENYVLDDDRAPVIGSYIFYLLGRVLDYEGVDDEIRRRYEAPFRHRRSKRPAEANDPLFSMTHLHNTDSCCFPIHTLKPALSGLRKHRE